MYEEYKKTIINVIQLLLNQDHTLQEICNILKFNDLNIRLNILGYELIKKNSKFILNQKD